MSLDNLDKNERTLAQKRMKLMLDSSPMCCEIWDSDYNIVDCNEAIIRLLDLKDKEEYLTGIYSFAPEIQPSGISSVETMEIAINKALAEGTYTFDWQYLLRDGTLIPTEVTLVTIKDEELSDSLLAYSFDKRTHIQMLEEIKLQRNTLQTIIDSMPDLVFTKDLNHEYTLVNKAAANFLNIDIGDIIGMNDREDLKFPEEIANSMIAADKRIFAGVPVAVNDNWIPAHDGTLRYYETTKAPIIHDGNIIGLVGVSRDITEKREMEEEMELAFEQVVAASKAKSDFLSSMSHEMRTPLNAIIGMTAIGKKGSSIEDKDYALNKIGEASSHLLGVINDILDMAKIEANKLGLTPIEYHFERMIQKVVTVNSFRLDEKEQTLSVSIDEKIPRFVVGDDQRLTQILTNLMSNAVKFTAEGGKISLNATLLSETKDDCELKIEVIDNGIGISSKQQERLFQAFEQAESGTSREYGGTGLGLAITKKLVELMGGTIWVESEIGKGSKFTFTVFLKRGANNPRSLLAPGVNWETLKVLAVDDMPEVREQFIDMFNMLGIKCDVAEDGLDACRIIEEQGSYDIYFVDWRMPRMDGIELTRKIKSRNDGRPSVVIMITAMDWEQIKDEAASAGVDRHMLKPLYSTTIIDCINECLGRAHLYDESVEHCYGEFAGKHILLAEDMEINREILIALLEDTGLLIDCAENGLEALKMVEAAPHKYDLIFMDVQMPKMDGYEATRLIRALPAIKDSSLPIIATTANVFQSDIDKCLAAGMDGHLGKPLDIDKVMIVLRKYL